jgi:hypothetical protein
MFVKVQNFTTKNNKISMEKRIVLTEPLFTGICKRGFIQIDNNTQVSFTTRDVALICKGQILEKQINDWDKSILVKFALQDIGFDMINEILKRSPLFNELAGNFINY